MLSNGFIQESLIYSTHLTLLSDLVSIVQIVQYTRIIGWNTRNTSGPYINSPRPVHSIPNLCVPYPGTSSHDSVSDSVHSSAPLRRPHLPYRLTAAPPWDPSYVHCLDRMPCNDRTPIMINRRSIVFVQCHINLPHSWSSSDL